MEIITIQLEKIPNHSTGIATPKPREVLAGLTFLGLLVAIMVFGLAI